MSTAKYLIESGASVDKQSYKGTIPPLDIAKMKQNEVLTELISKRIEEESSYIDYVSSFYPMDMVESSEITDESVEDTKGKENFARVLNINVGDQKNTVSIQTYMPIVVQICTDVTHLGEGTSTTVGTLINRLPE